MTVAATLDALFRAACARHPDALALADPPDRATVTDGAPRRLTYAQADSAIAALGARLREFGLPAESVVALHLPNTVESVVALLGVLRAGYVAAPLPLLWREQDAALALQRAGARALIGCRQIGETDFAMLAMQIAAETFAIRFVAAFGEGLPDGIVPLDDIFDSDVPVSDDAAESAAETAVITFDVTQDGIVPVARTDMELIAGGLAVHAEARLEAGAAILGALALSSFAGLATTVVPWLLSGGALSLHHPFAPASFAAQCAQAPRLVVVPGPLAARLADAELVGTDPAQTVLAVWRAPERLAGSAAWTHGGALIDVPVFGETGLIASRRAADGKSAPLREATRSAAGTLVLSGAMVPGRKADTLYPCRIDRDTKLLTVDGPPAGMVSVGGYRFALRALQELVEGAGEGTLAALPDVLTGHRLAGAAADRNAICDALLAQGANPLLIAAFRARRSEDRASAA